MLHYVFHEYYRKLFKRTKIVPLDLEQEIALEGRPGPVGIRGKLAPILFHNVPGFVEDFVINFHRLQQLAEHCRKMWRSYGKGYVFTFGSVLCCYRSKCLRVLKSCCCKQ